MKKVLLSMLVVATMALTINVKAVTNYTFDSYKSTMEGVKSGSVSRVSDHIIKLEGNSYEGNKSEGADKWLGMKIGPHIEGNAKLDSINEELYIDLNSLKDGGLFEISYSFKDTKGDYVNEVNVYTQRAGGVTKIYVTAKPEIIIAEIKDEDREVYKYAFQTYLKDGEPYALVTIYDKQNNKVGTPEEIKINDLKTNDTKTITDTTGDKNVKSSEVSLRWIWFCNIKNEGGINVYSLATPVVSKDNLSVVDSHVQDVLKEALESSQYAGTAKFEDVTVDVEVNKEANAVNEADKTAIKEKINDIAKGATIGEYFDISIAVRNAGKDKIGNLTNLSEEIELKVDLSDVLKSVPTGYTRNYFIVRLHDGIVTKLDTKLSEDGKSLTFKTDKFSTYAIAYEDTATPVATATTTQATETPENPQTLDKVAMYGGISLISLAGVYFGVRALNKKVKAN